MAVTSALQLLNIYFIITFIGLKMNIIDVFIDSYDEQWYQQ